MPRSIQQIRYSIEVARRGYKKYTKGWFYPELKSSYLKNRWKKDLDDVDLESWIKLYNKLRTESEISILSG